MRILFVSRALAANGPCPIVQAQGVSLIKLGIQLDYFTINNGGVSGYLKALFNLRRILKGNKFNIIHAHYGLTAIVALFAKKKEKLVVSFMGDDILGTNNDRGEILYLSKLFSGLNIFFAKTFYDFVIVKSHEMYSKFKISNISLLPNGVNRSVFYPKEKSIVREKLNLNNEDKIILFAANPDRAEKNFNLAKSSFNLICKNEFYKLKVVYNVDQVVLSDYFNAADVFILTSFHEGSPNVIKEAMACNCPIVSTDVGDVKWILGEINGCFLGGQDEKDFSLKIQMALEYAKENNKTKGVERIIMLGLDSSDVALKLVEIYKNILQ